MNKLNPSRIFFGLPVFLINTILVSSVHAETTKSSSTIPYEIPVEVKVYDPSTQSRMRLYGQNGQKIWIQHAFDCDGKKEGIREYLSSNGGLNAFKTYLRLTLNQVKGMPRTAIQKEVEGNTMSTYAMVSYKELILNVNQPINLYGFVLGAEDRARTKAKIFDQCSDAQASFQPQAGRDYEVLGRYENNKCQFQVFDLKSKQEVTVSEKLYSCPIKAGRFWQKN